MIEIKNVRKSYGELEVIKGIDLTIKKGEVLCLIGGSGSGKSTLLQCINGLEPIQAGKIVVDGTDVHSPQTDLNKLRQKLGIVFQQYNAFPHLTALENVALAPRLVKGIPKRQALELAREHLDYVGLGNRAEMRPASLSGGQQQRLAIARALAMKPDYMLFDEVTSALDPELVGEVLDTMRKLKDSGMTMIMVTHDISFARESGDRVAFFDSGLICEVGDARQVINNPREERTQQFLQRVLH
ncbi:amino acid ABC transporter ATP-binding protein [Pseudomonas aeruginosa]|uniref:amino acid ABC transporter ATP-binding protein n=1 Tax=Pseudomonas aeruginosa TaxID=287 RepID=UPI00044B24D5|nr:amino acid ABC transporter ATP-binding protein [Pseudomonas aeruginosa]KAJ10234.1 amino acid ABC transporter ATP-binding protein [Pseudomonas aeruginosa ID4365]MDP4470259.1 amino acid ABC transporter ATP-binding protein [Pseudomonas aeruginosa]MDP4476404.1 amino acid ABC transporter ATP-binding protein [Pseudomonas aeruginosa]